MFSEIPFVITTLDAWKANEPIAQCSFSPLESQHINRTVTTTDSYSEDDDDDSVKDPNYKSSSSSRSSSSSSRSCSCSSRSSDSSSSTNFSNKTTSRQVLESHCQSIKQQQTQPAFEKKTKKEKKS